GGGADGGAARRSLRLGVPSERAGREVQLQRLSGPERRHDPPVAREPGPGVLTYLARRLLAVVPVLFGVTLAVFSMLFLVPGDPVKMMLAEFVTNPDQVAQMRAQLHLDEPVLKQYARFVINAVPGDLGTSIRSRRPVATEIGENVGSTAQLAVASRAVGGVTRGPPALL